MSQTHKELVILGDRWVPTSRDAFIYELEYELTTVTLPGLPEEKRETEQGRLRIGISRTLSSIWDLDKEALRRVLYELGKRRLVDRAREETLSGEDELELTTASDLEEPPFRPENISFDIGQPIEVHVNPKSPIAAGSLSDIAGEIIELRDNVNALFYEHHNFRLLTLPQERYLLDLFLECSTREEFQSRVASLSGLSSSFNMSGLRQRLENDEFGGSIDATAEFLRMHYPSDDVNTFLDTISHLNRLRRMYPIHTDTASGVMQAFDFFDIQYPPSDFENAWETLLHRYREALEELISPIREFS